MNWLLVWKWFKINLIIAPKRIGKIKPDKPIIVFMNAKIIPWCSSSCVDFAIENVISIDTVKKPKIKNIPGNKNVFNENNADKGTHAKTINAKKPFNSIFNSKKFQPYSFKILFI